MTAQRESNLELLRILAWLIGIMSFLVFKNLRLPYVKTINVIASTTFGVLCIHAASSAMRKFLWYDTIDVCGHYGQSVYMVVAVMIVFAICSAIDLVRIKAIEKPFFRWLERRSRI